MIGVVALLGVLLALGIAPRLNRVHALKEQTEEASGIPVVSVVTPTQATEGEDLALPGSIEPVEQTAINSRTTGYVRRWYADLGARVKAGQVLAEIESPEVDQQLAQARADAVRAQATVAQARASQGTAEAGVQQARADAARLQSVVAQATSDSAKARATVEQARSETARAQAGVGQGQAEVARMRAALSQSKAALSRAEAALSQAREDLGTKKANLVRASADMEIARKTADRWSALVKEGAVSGQEADEKRAQFDGRQADVHASEAAVNSAQANVEATQAGVEAARADVDAAQESINSSQASVLAAQAGVGSGQANFQAMQSSEQSSRSSIQAAKSAWKSGQANVKAAQQRVEAARSDVGSAEAALRAAQANVRRYEVMQSFERVTAPFDGVVTARNVDNGALITAGATPVGGGTGDDSPTASSMRNGLFGIARTDTLRIRANVPQTFLPQIKMGQKAAVEVREFPRREFTGQITRVGGAFDPTSRTILVEVRLANPDGILKPGMYASVKLSPANAVRAIHIPATTLVIGADGTRVATVTPEHRVKFQAVQLGQDLGAEVEVASGLRGDEELIENPDDNLVDGSLVQPEAAKPKPEDTGGAGAPPGKPGRGKHGG